MEKYIAVDNIDSYYEQVVKRKFSPATVSKLLISLGLIIVIFIVAVILMVTVADWLFFIVITMFGLGCYLIYYLVKHSRIEYEYTFVLGELRIARIKGNAKRRNITYFDVKNIDDFGLYIDPDTGKRAIDPSKYPNLLHAAEEDYAPDTYYFIIHDKIRKKPAVLLMTPDEKTFSMIRPYLSVELKKKYLQLQKENGMVTDKAKAVSEAKESAPETAEPAPETAEPAPETAEPAPEAAESAPETKESAPETKEPAADKTDKPSDTAKPTSHTTKKPGQPTQKQHRSGSSQKGSSGAKNNGRSNKNSGGKNHPNGQRRSKPSKPNT